MKNINSLSEKFMIQNSFKIETKRCTKEVHNLIVAPLKNNIIKYENELIDKYNCKNNLTICTTGIKIF